jgi:hypothetical protein
MELSSLPARPLELSELRDPEESEYRLVAATVLVTEDGVLAAGYDHGTGWVRVDEWPVDDAEKRVRAANRALREWAEETDQRWADPDGGGTLLEAFRD